MTSDAKTTSDAKMTSDANGGPSSTDRAAFEAALDRLRSAAAHVTAAPLPPDYYPASHDVFEAASAQRGRLADALGALIEGPRFEGRDPVRFLSVGCGDGALDARLLSRAAPPRLDYVGVDPNAHSLDAFAARGALPRERLAHADFMRWEDDRRFDVVSAIHSLYYFDDKRAALARCVDRLAPGGVLAVAVAPFSKMNEIASVFWRDQMTGDFFSTECAALLRDMGLPFERREITASIPLARYDRAGSDKRLVDFTIQTETRALSPAVLDALYAVFDAAAETLDGEAALAHPVDLFVVEG